MRKLAVLVLCSTIAFGWGCSLPLTPEMLQALAQDNASFCATTSLSGGAGMMGIGPGGMIPGGGYGQTGLSFCRSNERGSILEVKPDGTLHIEHGVK